jgi:hypothetical protein
LGTDKLPNLKGNISAISVGELNGFAVEGPPQPGIHSFVSPVMEVSNTGAPSVVTGYLLSVIFPDGTVKKGDLISISNLEALSLTHSNGATETTHPDDFLPRKTLQPITKGALVQGRMFYIIPGASAADLTTIGTIYRIEFADLWRRKYKAEFKYTTREDRVLDFAGMHPQNVTVESPTPKPQP